MGNYLKNLLAAASHTALPTLGGAALGGSLGYLLSDKDNSNTNALVGAVLGGGLGLGGSSAIKSLSEKAQGIADDGLASLVKNFDTTANGMHEEMNQLIRQLSDGAAGTSEKLKASMDDIATSILASAQNSHDMSDIYGKISKSALIGTLPTAIIAKYLNTRPKETTPTDIIIKESSYRKEKTMNPFEQDIIARYYEKLASLIGNGMEKDATPTPAAYLQAMYNRMKNQNSIRDLAGGMRASGSHDQLAKALLATPIGGAATSEINKATGNVFQAVRKNQLPRGVLSGILNRKKSAPLDVMNAIDNSYNYNDRAKYLKKLTGTDNEELIKDMIYDPLNFKNSFTGAGNSIRNKS